MPVRVWAIAAGRTSQAAAPPVGVEAEGVLGGPVDQHIAAVLDVLDGQGRGQQLDDRLQEALGLDLVGHVAGAGQQADHRAGPVAHRRDGGVAIDPALGVAEEGAEVGDLADPGDVEGAVQQKRLSSGQISRQGRGVGAGREHRLGMAVGVLDRAVQPQDPGALLAGVQDVERAIAPVLFARSLALHSVALKRSRSDSIRTASLSPYGQVGLKRPLSRKRAPRAAAGASGSRRWPRR